MERFEGDKSEKAAVGRKIEKIKLFGKNRNWE